MSQLFYFAASAWSLIVLVYLLGDMNARKVSRKFLYRHKNFRHLSHLMILAQLAVLLINDNVGRAYSADVLKTMLTKAPFTAISAVCDILGILLILAGTYLCCRARMALGIQWDRHASFIVGCTLVKSGPYRYSRNPLYLGQLMVIFGVPLITMDVFTASAAIVASFSFYSRALREESLLASNLGAAYEDYAREVPRMLPSPIFLARVRRQGRAPLRGGVPEP